MGEFRKRSAAELEHEIARARQDLVSTVQQIEVVVRDRLDWRSHVRRHPVAFVGAAFAVGFLFAAR